MPVPPLIALSVGAATGLIGSLLGLGGGVFLVPLLTLVLGVPIRSAIAVSLISVIATASASARLNLDRGLVNLRLGLVLEIATSVGGLSGGIVSSLLTPRQLFGVFALVLSAMAVLMASRAGRRNVVPEAGADPGLLGGRIREGGVEYIYRAKRMGLGLLASLLAGTISGLLGLGGGILKVPVLNSFCGIPIKVATATSSFMIGVTAATSAFIYFARGDVNLPLASAVALGTLPASLLGARLTDQIQARALKILMAIVLGFVAVRMILVAL